jgi:LacI family transcriptional regulator
MYINHINWGVLTLATTINDIAKLAGVSVATVSRVINRKPDVKAATKERVDNAIEHLNYSPNTVARGLVLKNSKVIGFIVPDIKSPNFPELARGIIAQAKKFGYSVMFFDTNHDDEIVKETIRLLQSKQVDGIILSFDSANRDELIRLRRTKFPVVQIYQKSPEITVPTIKIDNFGSGYFATRYLLEMGHTIIGHITTGNETQSGSERLKGYRKALEEKDISFRNELVQTGSHTYKAGIECMDRLLQLNPRPTAVFASHDLMAIGAYNSIARHGLSIPADISIIGHDNIEMSDMVIPKLTTVDTFKYTLGQEGVNLLVKEMAEKTGEATEQRFPTKLIIRESVSRISRN